MKLAFLNISFEKVNLDMLIPSDLKKSIINR